MKEEYDFSKGKRGAVVPSGKQRITIRLDADVIEFFKDMVEEQGGGNYQTAINDALHEYISGMGMSEIVRETVSESVKEEFHRLAGNDYVHSSKSRYAVNRSYGGWRVKNSGAATKAPIRPKRDSISRARWIAEAAYYLAEQRGFAAGDPVQDWLDAAALVDKGATKGLRRTSAASDTSAKKSKSSG